MKIKKRKKKLKKQELTNAQAAEVEILPPEEPEDSGWGNEGYEPASVSGGQAAGLPTRYDALTAYLREIRSYPRLTREQEQELALKYYHDRDLEAAYKLVKANLWLVVKIAREYQKAARSFLDLIQEGNIGLMEAVKNFDPYRGVRFPSYASWWVRAYIIRYVIANWRMVKIGTTQAQRKLFFNLNKEKERLEREGFHAGPKLLAHNLDVKESEIIEMQQRLSSPDISVDAPLSDDGESDLLSILPADDQTAEELVANKEIKTILNKGLKDFSETLNQKEKVIFEKRMLGEEKATLQVLSEELGVSRERVRQIENRIREKLKNYLEERFGPSLSGLMQGG